MAKVTDNITLENAKIIYRNFEGREGQFNAEGERNFCLILDESLAEVLQRDGWNVKTKFPKNKDDDPFKYIQVRVRFGKINPKIVLIKNGIKRELDEESVKILDFAELKKVDVVVRPYNWQMASGKTGVKAYLKTLYATLVVDEFEEKYKDVPNSLDKSSEEDEIPF